MTRAEYTRERVFERWVMNDLTDMTLEEWKSHRRSIHALYRPIIPPISAALSLNAQAQYVTGAFRGIF